MVPTADAPSSPGAYRAVFFRAAAGGRSAGRPVAGWPAGSCGWVVAAGGAGSPARAGDAWWPVIGCSPLLGVMAVFLCLRLSLVSLPVAAGPGVRMGDSLLVLPAGVHGQTRTRDPDKMPAGAAARV